MDATFAIGYVKEGLVSISARSKSDINVGNIMSELGGGGNGISAACKIETDDILAVEEQLKEIVSRNIQTPPTDGITGIAIAPTIIDESIHDKPYVKMKA
jgi:c-di-AMP phosphodiesterase-like protein